MYPRFSHIPQSREWIWTSLHLFFRRALNQCQLRTARCLIPQLHVAGSYKEEWRLVALMEEAAYLEKFESPDSAHQILFTLVEELQANEKRQYQKLKIEALLRLAQLIMNADNTTDTTSLPHLLTARQLLTKKPYPVELHCRAAILVAYHMLRGGSPGLPGRALNIVRTASQRIGANDLATTSDPAAVPTIDLGTLAAIERALAECKAEVILAHEGPEVGNAAADETMDIGDQASRFEKESFTWDTVLGHCRRALSRKHSSCDCTSPF
ncbi:hypothetical protein DFJ73DRAFT_300416 [Zopfochytrium polystomum]|nr:hypothetical protein DFJ73DRAFT_300416 [Zopfochytrium polystomum]